MKRDQLKRASAHRLLKEYRLLQKAADTSGPGSDVVSILVCRGWELVSRLANELRIILSPVSAASPLLQGSHAAFRPQQGPSSIFAGTLVYNCDLPLPQQVFAVAHELAHVVLHKGHIFCRDTDLDNLAPDVPPLSGQVEVYNAHNLREREANLFALELLMPYGHLRAEYLRRVRERLVDGRAHNDVVSELASFFEVDRQRVLAQLTHVFLSPEPVLSFATTTADCNKQEPDRSRGEGFEAEAQAGDVRGYEIDPQQSEAARADAPLLLIAGPGSGKTSALAERVRHLVEETGANPGRLLILTFSNQAVGELRDRLVAIGLPADEMQIATFHAYGLDFLRRYAESCNLVQDFRLLDPARAHVFLEDIHDKLPVGFHIRNDGSTFYFDKLLEDISRAKDYLHTHQEYAAHVEEMRSMMEGNSSDYSAVDVRRADERSNVYRVYEEQKRLRGLVDFGDLIMLPVGLMRSDVAVREEERGRYDHILVDEYQDVNFASGELLRLLASPAQGGTGNLWAVSDVHQSIYRWRGAFPSQAGRDNFIQDYSDSDRRIEAGVRELEYNYRSVEPIVALATHLRALMPDRSTLPLKAVRMSDGTTSKENSLAESLPEWKPKPALYYTEFESTAEELAAIAASITTNHTEGHAYSEHAVLCRRHEQADAVAEALMMAGIPVARVGEFYSRPEVQEVVAAVAALASSARVPLVRLGHGRLSMSHVFGLADKLGLTPIQALKDSRVLELLEPKEQQEADRLSGMLAELASRRSIWGVITDYIFSWSTLIPDLVERLGKGSGGQAAKQGLYVLGQLLLIAHAFDKEEEARSTRSVQQRSGDGVATGEWHPGQKNTRTRHHLARFMRYYDALLHSDSRVDIDLGPDSEATSDSSAVHIMTANASKGLEFDFVYLFGMHHTSPPKSVLEPAPPNFHDDSGNSTSKEDDERSLFYVAATRARDRLYISWAKHEKPTPRLDEEPEAEPTNEPEDNTQRGGAIDWSKGKSKGSAGNRKGRGPSRVLEPVFGFMELKPDLWGILEPAPALARMIEVQTTSASWPLSESASGVAGVARDEFDYWELRTYDKCPSKHYYKHGHRCTGRLDSSKSNFYRGVKVAQKELIRALSEGESLPGLEALLHFYNSEWPTPLGTPLEVLGERIADYASLAEADGTSASPMERGAEGDDVQGEESDMLNHWWQRGVRVISELHRYYSGKEGGESGIPSHPQPLSTTFDQRMTVQLTRSNVSFYVDRVEVLPDGSKRLVCVHVGDIVDEKELDGDTDTYRLLALYALSQEGEAAPAQVILEGIGLHGVRQIVAGKAYKKANAYRKLERGETTATNLLRVLDDSAGGIKAGRFSPKRDRHCVHCQFYPMLCSLRLD